MFAPWEPILWLIFVAISVGGLGITALGLWMTGRSVVKGLKGMTRPDRAPQPLVLPALGTVTVRNYWAVVAMIWMAMLVLVPLFLLALWALAVELTSRRIGGGLVFAIVHLFLLWQLLRLGTRVQRKVEISRSALTTHPVLGGVRELPWGSIARVEDVKYAGPGVSGLYLYQGEGSSAVIDGWLLEWDSVRATIRLMTPHADWTQRVRGWLVG